MYILYVNIKNISLKIIFSSIILMRCVICLQGNINYKSCCNIHVHKKCQKKWGKECIICKQPIEHIKTKKKYIYVPPEPELTNEELREQISIMREIRERNSRRHEELRILRSRTNTVDYVRSFFEDLI